MVKKSVIIVALCLLIGVVSYSFWGARLLRSVPKRKVDPPPITPGGFVNFKGLSKDGKGDPLIPASKEILGDGGRSPEKLGPAVRSAKDPFEPKEITLPEEFSRGESAEEVGRKIPPKPKDSSAAIPPIGSLSKEDEDQLKRQDFHTYLRYKAQGERGAAKGGDSPGEEKAAAQKRVTDSLLEYLEKKKAEDKAGK